MAKQITTKKKKSKSKSKKNIVVEYIQPKDTLDVIIGWDVSSTTVGWAALYVKDGYIINVDYSFYKPEDKENKLASLIKLQENVNIIITKVYESVATCFRNFGYSGLNKVNYHVGVEDHLLFMKGKSSAQTITTLSVYNRTLCMAVYNKTGIVPTLMPVATIRSILRKLSGSKEIIDKDHVPQTVESIIGSNWMGAREWKFRWLQNQIGNTAVECFDMADGIAAAISCAYLCGVIKGK